MKKIFLNCALVIALLTPNVVSAESKIESPVQHQVNTKEIVSYSNQSTEQLKNVENVAIDTSVGNDSAFNTNVPSESKQSVVPVKMQNNLKKVASDTIQSAAPLENVVPVAVNTSGAEDDVLKIDGSLKGENISHPKKEKRIFSRLNPIVPILIINKAIESTIGHIDGVAHIGLNKLDGTPFHDLKKIDKAIDTGASHLKGAVDAGLDSVDKTVEMGLDDIDKVLNSGIEKTEVKQWLDGDFAAGRFFGARPILENHGITINSSLLYSPFVKTTGGASGRASTKGYSLFNLGAKLDTAGAGLWKGGTAFVLYQRKLGYGIAGTESAMGDYMGLDGWDWREMNQISEYWYQQSLFNNKLRMKFGKQDSNTDFGYLNSGWDFMNTALSVNPTSPLPTYPDSYFGFMAELNLKEWLSIRDGIYNKAGCAFNITELEVKTTIKKLPGRYMLGAWETGDSAGMGATVGETPTGEAVYNNYYRNYGGYFDFEQLVYKEKKDDPNDMQGLVVLGQFGVSPSGKNDMSQYMSGGLHYLGPIPKRDKDIVGLAVGSGNFASRLSNISIDNGGRVGRETFIEAFYRIVISPWLYIQPDVQFIMNPGGLYANSVAIGLRSVISF